MSASGLRHLRPTHLTAHPLGERHGRSDRPRRISIPDVVDRKYDRPLGSRDRTLDVMTSVDVSKEEAAPAWRWHDHIGTLLTVFSIAFVSIRLFSIAGYNRETAYALIQYASTTTVLLGTVVSALPIMLILGLFYGLAVTSHAIVNNRKVSPAAIIGILTAIIGAVFVAPIVFGVFFLAPALLVVSAVGIAALVRYVRKDKNQAASATSRTTTSRYRRLALRRRQSLRLLAISLSALSILWLFVFSLSSVPWMAPERLVFDGKDQPVTAYVLSDANDGMLVLLLDKPRRIEREPVAHIVNRQICQRTYDNFVDRYLAEPRAITGAFPHYPACP